MILNRVVWGLVIGLALVVNSSNYAHAATAPEVGHESAANEHGGGDAKEVNTDPLELQTDLAIWTGVVFLILMAILWKFAWGPIARGLESRERGVADQIEQAGRSNQEAKELLGQYEQKLADSKDEVRTIIDQGRRDAERVGREMLDKAKAEAQAEQERAVQQIDLATIGALKELAEESANLAVELAGKIVRAELKADDHARLIQQTMAGFAQQPPSKN